MTTGIGCGTGLALGAAYDELQKSKDKKERQKLENRILDGFKKQKKRNRGKIIGLASGCLAGLGTGLYLNMMKADFQDAIGDNGIILEDVYDKSGELTALKVRMDGDITFDEGKADLKGRGKSNVEKMTNALDAYPETDLAITGHISATNPEKSTRNLSDNRAKQVANIMATKGIDRKRITVVKGLGAKNPVPGSKPSDGVNRRVEVKILPRY